MKILLVTPEMSPFAKTGGLADVAGALPKALAELGHEVAVALPLYGTIDRQRFGLRRQLSNIVIDLPPGWRSADVWSATVDDEAYATPLQVHFVHDEALFGRRGLYGEGGLDYPDNPQRFAYFSLAIFWMIRGLNWIPDVILCNDWQTALVPIYQARHWAVHSDPELQSIPVVFAIHNIGFQGIYPPATLEQIGLPWEVFNPDELEFYGKINLLKGALIHSDWIVTVSRQYAREIQQKGMGGGLEGVLQGRADRITGILNGIDTEIWNPRIDNRLPANYSAGRLRGKVQCKKALRERFGLPSPRRTPLIGCISRLTEQKGMDLMIEVLPEMLRENVQFVLLGTGQPEYHAYFQHLARDFPGKVGIELGFDDDLAHLIEAGSDMFLMPSRFEPCGLNQMYSLKYGTVPIVRRTGGLADTVVNYTPRGLESGRATGFVFKEYTAEALLAAIRKAVGLYTKDAEAWGRLMRNGMLEDFSWSRSARAYERLFRQVVRQKATPV